MPSNIDNVTLPHKKRSILWLLAALFLILIGLFVFQLIGPDPQIIVSPQTTYITTPLGAGGLPDYERYILDRYRDGVTPQNNAAALLWVALWPGELRPPHYAIVAKELGLSGIPSQAEALVPTHRFAESKSFKDWLIAKLQLSTPEAPDDRASENPNRKMQYANQAVEHQRQIELATESILEQAKERPWTTEQIPPLADWVRQNQKPLDLIVQASRLPRCYFPSTPLLNNESEPLFSMLLPGAQGVREAGRSLPARAMWHLGENRPLEAWQDLLAVHHIGRLVTQGPTLVEQLVGIAIDGLACNGTQALLHQGNLTAEQASQIRRDLDSLPPFAGMATSIDTMERTGALDAIIHLAKSNEEDLRATMELLGNDTGALPALQYISVDWNLVLQQMNRLYDQLADAAALETRAERMAAFDKAEREMNFIVTTAQRPSSLALSVVSRGQRSELVAAIMVGMFMPAMQAASNAEDRANAMLELTKLAAALAEYRATHGSYPESLDELVPAILSKVPVDTYNGKPFVYKREGEGYLLYSTGDNGVDDAGSNETQRIFHGHKVDATNDNLDLQPAIPAGADDISIRAPSPPLKLPVPDPPPTDAQ